MFLTPPPKQPRDKIIQTGVVTKTKDSKQVLAKWQQVSMIQDYQIKQICIVNTNLDSRKTACVFEVSNLMMQNTTKCHMLENKGRDYSGYVLLVFATLLHYKHQLNNLRVQLHLQFYNAELKSISYVANKLSGKQEGWEQ